MADGDSGARGGSRWGVGGEHLRWGCGPNLPPMANVWSSAPSEEFAEASPTEASFADPKKMSEYTEEPLGPPEAMRELVLAGAASRGIAYLGALDALGSQGLLWDLEEVVGVSAGALVGVCYLSGMTVGEMFRVVAETQTKELFDPPGKESLLRGAKFRAWVWGILGHVGDMGLGEFSERYGRIRIVAVSLENGMEVLSAETAGDMPVGEALLATMALPLVFPPVRWGGRTYVDGGLLNNLPMSAEDAVGLTVTSGALGVAPMFGRMLQLVSEEMGRLRPTVGRVLGIDASDFGMLDFNLSLDDKVTLYMRGREACGEYIGEVIGRVVGEVLGEILAKVSCG